MDKQLTDDQADLVEDILDHLENVANEKALLEEQWENAHASALRDFLVALKTAYENEYGPVQPIQSQTELHGSA